MHDELSATLPFDDLEQQVETALRGADGLTTAEIAALLGLVDDTTLRRLLRCGRYAGQFAPTDDKWSLIEAAEARSWESW